MYFSTEKSFSETVEKTGIKMDYWGHTTGLLSKKDVLFCFFPVQFLSKKLYCKKYTEKWKYSLTELFHKRILRRK